MLVIDAKKRKKRGEKQEKMSIKPTKLSIHSDRKETGNRGNRGNQKKAKGGLFFFRKFLKDAELLCRGVIGKALFFYFYR